ncbi:MAG: hypothetical protein NTX38_16115 [Methylobacter sp.]|nr:hypothetical protein [Methylobacter sp.]
MKRSSVVNFEWSSRFNSRTLCIPQIAGSELRTETPEQITQHAGLVGRSAFFRPPPKKNRLNLGRDRHRALDHGRRSIGRFLQ